MPPIKPNPALAAALAMATLVATGCQSAMSNQPRESSSQPGTAHEYPLRFDQHSFSAHCFNTKTCRVEYANTIEVAKNEPSPAPRPDHLKSLGLSAHVGIDNFPAPAKVEWISLDGTQLTATVDIGEIFGDERILHRVQRDQLPDKTVKHGGAPTIILEVNDRTLTVYMRAMVFLKDDGRSPAPFREDVLQAWQKTF